MSPCRQTETFFVLCCGDGHIAHAGEQFAQFLRLRMGEFDEFEPVGAGRILALILAGGASCGNGPMASSFELLKILNGPTTHYIF